MELCQVVTEGETDVLLLQAVLDIPPDSRQITFIAAGGWSNADSYARTVLVQDKAHIALVVDADSRDPNGVENRRRFLHRSLQDVTLHKKHHVTVIEPEIAGLLFEDPSLLHSLFGKPLSDTQLGAAYYEPRRVLSEVTQRDDLTSILREKLPNLGMSRLRALPAIRALKEFLVRLTSKAPVSR